MKKTNLRFNLRIIPFIIIFFVFTMHAFAEVNSVVITSLVPPNPNPGDYVTVSFNYCVGANEESRFMAAVSTSSVFQAGGTVGQSFKVSESGTNNGGVGDGAASVSGGYDMNDQQGAAHCPATSFGFNIPNTLEGGTYYVVIGGKIWYVDSGGSPAAAQASIAFTVPLPPASASITQTAQNSSVQAGDYILYTIDYTFVNANNFVITDVVPPNCTLIEQSPGGTNGGTAAGSSLTWTIGNTASRKTSSIWFLVQVGAGTPAGTIINNNAHWTMTEDPTGLDSNITAVTVEPPFALLKSQNVASANIGDTVTYAFDFAISGLSLKSYDSFDANILGYTATGGTWSWEAEVGGGGYLKSPTQGAYPHYLRNTPSNFCFGILESDVWIGDKFGAGANNWDALVVFRDNGLSGAAGKAYGVGISSDNNPANMYLQEVNAPETAYAVRAISGVTGGVSNRTWYTIKIDVSDAGSGNVRVRAKAWKKGTAEPGAWNIDWTDVSGSTPPCGYVGFQGHEFNPNLYDNMKVFQSTLAASNAVLYDTVPSQLNYLGGTPADLVHGAPVFSGGMVSWTFPGTVDNYNAHMEWWAEVTGCGQIINKGSFKPNWSAAPIDSNSVTMNVICPNSPTNTPTFTASPTATPSFTPTASPTATFTATPTATRTNTPIIPQFTISKAVAPGSAGRGETVTYTIHYVNTGLIGLTNFEVWDTLPTEIENIANVTAPGIYTSATGIINWIIPFVATGASGDVSFTATLKNTVTRDQVIGNRAYGNVLLANSAVESNAANVTANVPLLELTPVTNYPNPFDGATTIVFDLTILADNCSIKFFTISGEPVKNMDFTEMKSPVPGGNLQTSKNASGGWTYKVYWDGTNTAGNKLSSGVYLYRIKASAGNEEKKAMGRLAILR